MKQRRNVAGVMITRYGTPDCRAVPRPLPQPTHSYAVLCYPLNKKPWQVFQTELATGERKLVGRFTTERAAERGAELRRQQGPDCKPSNKMLHKLGIDQRK